MPNLNHSQILFSLTQITHLVTLTAKLCEWFKFKKKEFERALGCPAPPPTCLKSPVIRQFTCNAGEFLGRLIIAAMPYLKRPGPRVTDLDEGSTDVVPVESAVGGRPVVVLRIVEVDVLKMRTGQARTGCDNLGDRIVFCGPRVAGIDDQSECICRVRIHERA